MPCSSSAVQTSINLQCLREREFAFCDSQLNKTTTDKKNTTKIQRIMLYSSSLPASIFTLII